MKSKRGKTSAKKVYRTLSIYLSMSLFLSLRGKASVAWTQYQRRLKQFYIARCQIRNLTMWFRKSKSMTNFVRLFEFLRLEVVHVDDAIRPTCHDVTWYGIEGKACSSILKDCNHCYTSQTHSTSSIKQSTVYILIVCQTYILCHSLPSYKYTMAVTLQNYLLVNVDCGAKRQVFGKHRHKKDIILTPSAMPTECAVQA